MRKIKFTKHATDRIKERNIGFMNVRQLLHSNIPAIASESCLAVSGETNNGRALRAIVSATDKIIKVITVYPVRKRSVA